MHNSLDQQLTRISPRAAASNNKESAFITTEYVQKESVVLTQQLEINKRIDFSPRTAITF